MKGIFTATIMILSVSFLSQNKSEAEGIRNFTHIHDDSKSSIMTELYMASVSDPLAEAKCEAWVDSLMNTLSLGERIAQLFVPRLDIFDNADGRNALRKMVETEKVGGFLLGKGTIEGYASLINFGQEHADVPLMVTLDGEWGPSMRLTDAPRFPYNMGLGAGDDEQLMYDYGLEVARECKEIGINVNFAPVLDVNSNPDNPVIGYRSFGENPEKVARLGKAYSKGLEDGGVMSVAKHFPGHGDTSEDSHLTLPTVKQSYDEMQNIDLAPFREYINAGLSGIMVGHLIVPALDDSTQPASLSSVITTDLLKHRLGFRGLVFTDALAMKGAKSAENENNCVSALKAGADVLLGSASPVNDIKAVKNAVESGKISRERIDESCRKILRYKYKLGLADYKPVQKNGLKQRVNGVESQTIRQRLANASVTAIYNRKDILPVRELSKRDIAVVNIGAPADNEFSKYCSKYAKVKTYSVEGNVIGNNMLKEIEQADIVIIGIFSTSAWAKNSYDKLASLSGAIPVFFMNPYKMSQFGPGLRNSETLVTVYDNTPELQIAAAQALFGGIEVNGRFPVNVANIAPEGTGVTIEKSRLGYATPHSVGFTQNIERIIDSIAIAGSKRGAFPGCQVIVAKNGAVVLDKAYGKLEKGGQTSVTTETLYDIASMTKATATIGGVMKAYDEGLFEIGDKASQYIPGLEGTDKKNITLKELMLHESGLPPIVSVNKIMMDPESYEGPLTRSRQNAQYNIKIARGVYGNSSVKMRNDIIKTSPSSEYDIEIAKGLYGGYALRDTMMSRIYQAPLRASKSYKYSCLNYCLLMEMEENVTGVDHDQWVETEIFSPLGAWHTGFRPTEYYKTEMIAPTEYDSFLRKQTVRGFVHDEIAAFSGGVQGNAGLFSTAGDIAKYAQMLLQNGYYGKEQLISQSTVRKFTGTKNAKGTRTLGFDLLKGFRGKGDESWGEAFGHTGFTGTCFWIDPDEEIIFVFLSNRVNPTRDNTVFSEMNPRGEMMKAIYADLDRNN